MEPPHFSRALHKIKAASDLSGTDLVIIYSDGSVTDQQGELLGTSTTKINAAVDRKAFATLRFAGDDLDPAEISAILPVKPARAHRKGEEFFAGPRAGTLRGRTGIWFLATDKLVDSDELSDHLKYIEELLYPSAGDSSRINALRAILDRTQSRAHVTCFWHGRRREPVPHVTADFKSAIAPLNADVEIDFLAPIAQRKRVMLPSESSKIHKFEVGRARRGGVYCPPLD
jgi:hypothetical protein